MDLFAIERFPVKGNSMIAQRLAVIGSHHDECIPRQPALLQFAYEVADTIVHVFDSVIVQINHSVAFPWFVKRWGATVGVMHVDIVQETEEGVPTRTGIHPSHEFPVHFSRALFDTQSAKNAD